MNAIAIKHLAWKEIRHIGPILLALGVAVAILIAISNMRLINTHGNILQSSHWIWTACMIICSLGGMTIGVSIFSMEKEQGAAGLLANFPIAGPSVVAGKLITGLLATILFSMIVLLALTLLCWSENSFRHELVLNSTIGKLTFLLASIVLPAVELFAWGAFFAMLTDRTLLSAIFAALTNSLSIYFTQDSITVASETFLEGLQSPHANAFGIRLLIAVSVLVVDCYFANRWCNQPIKAASLVNSRFLNRANRKSGSRLRAPFSKLIWQSVHQAKWTLLGSVFAIAATSFFLVNSLGPHHVDSQHRAVFVLAPALFTLIGLCVFWNDQHKQAFHFFQQHAEHGRWIWISRMMLGLFVFAIGFVAFTICSYVGANSFLMSVGEWSYQDPFRQDDSILLIQNVVPLFTICFGCFAIGQLFSMFFRSLILGPLFALIASYVFALWAFFLFPLYVGYWWTILPLGMAMLLATFLHAPHWISETKKTSSALRTCAMIAGTFAFTVIGILSYRAYEIPQIAQPLLLPAEIKDLKPGDFPSVWPDKYSELAEKWNANPVQQSVFEDDLEHAFRDRKTLTNALKNAEYFGLYQADTESVEAETESMAPISQERLEQFIKSNQESIDALMSIKEPYGVMPTWIQPNQKTMRAELRELLLGNAEFHLRNDNLIESYDSIAQFVALAQVIHYKVDSTELAAVQPLWEKWMDHPEHSAETLRYGQLSLPPQLGASANIAYFDLKELSDEHLAARTRARPWLKIPSETTRYRRLNEYHALVNTRDALIVGNMLRETRHMARFSRNNFFDSRTIGSMPEKWGSPSHLRDPGPALGTTGYYFPMSQVKHELLMHKAEHGEFPTAENFENVYTYKPTGMDGDVYLWDGFELKLLIEKGEPFLLSFSGDWERGQRGMKRLDLFEHWKGKPDPDAEPTFQIELVDGTKIESSMTPKRLSDGYGPPKLNPSALLMYSISPVGNNHAENTQIPISQFKSVTPMREVGDEETTYLLRADPDYITLLRL